MFQELSESDWNQFIAQHPDAGVFDLPSCLKATAAVYHAKINYFAYLKNNQILVAIAVFVKDDKIIVPHHYYRSSFLILKDQNPLVINQAIIALLTTLKERTKSIQIALPLNIQDIRPFIWTDFQPQIRYTYIKELETLDYHENINRNIKKAEKNQFTYAYDTDYEASLRLHQQDLKLFGISTAQNEQLSELFKQWIATGLLKSFNAYKDGVLIASNLLLCDEKQNIAYKLMISTSVYNELGVQSALYDYTFQLLKEKGFQKVDLYGANMQSIADFKGKFNPELHSFFVLTYSAKRKWLKPIYKVLDYLIK